MRQGTRVKILETFCVSIKQSIVLAIVDRRAFQFKTKPCDTLDKNKQTQMVNRVFKIRFNVFAFV